MNIKYYKKFKKDIESIDKNRIKQILKLLKTITDIEKLDLSCLRENSFDKLKGDQNLYVYKKRFGDYRLIISIREIENNIIYVEKVGHRRDVYRSY